MDTSEGQKGPTTDHASRKEWRWFWIVAAPFLTVVVLNLAIHDRALVDPIPWIFRGIGVLAGLAFGMMASIGLARRPNKNFGAKEIITCVGLLGFAAVTGSYYARFAYETFSFLGQTPTSYSQWVVVEQKDGPRRRSLAYSATITPIDGGREISVPIDEELYDRLEPYREPGRDCLVLDGESTPQGVRRVRVPTKLFDTLVGVRQYRPCAEAPKR
ncbi:MAG: hypothetical protein J0H88_21975 [Sphingomonadales bacterium]|nr:hypothetical protein [Sphingomonadales bacterium]